ncbi:hypothetical protein ALC62_11884 [Cyphomyrmex costatus]|uniref:Uncharacterized protein n=1 Tax=Cyphomyrmex costatus TaxID=456900 RepID=A0A195CA72_9HYME|nr:hypothetical protein ALC62_11884 [Cyphomyrmex costatus]
MSHNDRERFAYEITRILLRLNFKNDKVKRLYEDVLITRINVICESDRICDCLRLKRKTFVLLLNEIMRSSRNKTSRDKILI